jgi:hypothetical protein
MIMNRMLVAATFAALVPAGLSAQTQVQTQAGITSGVIYACHVKSSGTVYRIKAPNTPEKCATNHTEFSWNAQGPQGPAGPQGPVGPQGPEGPAGAGGLAGFEIVAENYTDMPQGEALGMGADCPEGKVLIGGGFEITADVTHQVMASMPYVIGGETLPRRWGVTVKAVAGLGIRIYAICVTAPS